MHERGATGYSLSVDGGACGGVQGVGGTGVGVVTSDEKPRFSGRVHTPSAVGTSLHLCRSGTPPRLDAPNVAIADRPMAPRHTASLRLHQWPPPPPVDCSRGGRLA